MFREFQSINDLVKHYSSAEAYTVQTDAPPADPVGPVRTDDIKIVPEVVSKDHQNLKSQQYDRKPS